MFRLAMSQEKPLMAPRSLQQIWWRPSTVTSKTKYTVCDLTLCWAHRFSHSPDVQEHIDKLERTALVAGERQDVIDYCLANISRLTTEVQDALDFIPAYDQRSYTTVCRIPPV